MEGNLKYLKWSLVVEIVLGIALSLFMALFIGVMATDSPASGKSHFLAGTLVGFIAVALPTVVFPYFCIRELNSYPVKKSIKANLFHSILVGMAVFFPVALWQIYVLLKLKRD